MSFKIDPAIIKNSSNKYQRNLTVQFRATQLENEEENKEYAILEGKAVAFNSQTELYRCANWNGGTTIVNEIIEPRAFDNTDTSDVLFDLNHDWNGAIPLARTRNKSLTLDIREDGVYFSAKIKRSNAKAMEVYEAVQDGLLDRCSFMFTTDDDGITYEESQTGNDSTVLRRITAISRLFDVSVVNIPAYDSTSIDARSAKDLERYFDKCDTERIEKRRQEVLNGLKDVLFR